MTVLRDLPTLSEFEQAKILRPLTDIQKRVIRLRFGLNNGGMPATAEGVAQATGLTKEQVLSIEHEAITQLALDFT